MNYLKITTGLLGIIFFIVGALMTGRFSNLKEKRFNISKTYYKRYPTKIKIADCLFYCGCLLMGISCDIKN